MHPDAIITGLRRELERLDPAAADYAERKQQIEHEIRHAAGLPRPEAKADDQNTIADPNVGYLAGLKRELARSARDRRDEIKAEIERIEKILHDKASQTETPAEESAAAAEQEQPADTDADEPVEGDADGDDTDGEPAADDYFSAEFEASKSRVDLDEIAASLGVPNPDKLQNKGAVVDAIRAAAAEQEQQ